MISTTTNWITTTDEGQGASTLEQLTDVQITSVQDGDVLTFSTIDNKWINAPTADPTITLTGDITGTGIGSISTTLATVNSNVGSFGDGTHVGAFTVNAKGLVTAASSTAISFPVTSVNSYTGDVTLTKSDVGLGSVENTALSTWAGTSNITTVGTISSGTWKGNTIGITYGGTGATTQAGAANAVLPSQATHSGKYLTTNGTDVSWATVSGGVSWATYGGTPGTLTNNSTAGSLLISFGSSATSTIQSSGTTSRVLAIGSGISTTGTTADNILLWNTGSTTSNTLTVNGVTYGLMIASGSTSAMTITNSNFVHISPRITNSTQPGANSTCIGFAARATGGSSVAIGTGAVTDSNSAASVAIGSSATVYDTGAVAIGDSTTARGKGVAIGSNANTGSTSFSNNNVAIGDSASAYGTNPKIATDNVAIGHGVDIVTFNNSVDVYRSIAIGTYAKAQYSSCISLGNNNCTDYTGHIILSTGAAASASSVDSNTQNSKSNSVNFVPLNIQTTNATETEMKSGDVYGGSGRINGFVGMPNNCTYMCKLIVSAQNGTTDQAGWDISFCITRGANAAATALVGSVTGAGAPGFGTAGTGSWAVNVTADTTNGRPAVKVTGVAATTINWQANITYVKAM